MDKFWTKRYPEGVPAEIDADRYASVVGVFTQTCQKYAERPAFANMGRSLTFSELDAASRDLAGYLQKGLRLAKGERVAVMMPNLLQYPVAVFGILRAGLTAVNVNPLYTPRELEHQLKDAGATTIIIIANFAHVLEEVIGRTSVRNVIVTQIGDMLPFPKSLLVNFIVKYVKKMVPAYRLPSAVPLKRALSEGRRLGFDEVEVSGDDLAFLQYTGGTTGVAKGAMLTHRNMVANMEQVSAWLGPSLVPGKEVIITPLPLYHIFCLTANCLCFMKFGGLNVLITNPRDFPAFVTELSKWPFTAITGVNTLFNALVNNEAFAGLDFSHLRLSVGGGMAVQKAVAERWKAVTGVHMMEGYGLTESSPVVTMNPADLTEHRGSIGLPAPSTEVSIRDDSGVEQPVGGEGELWVRGPQVMRGYWQRPEETAKTITEDGWLMTGDIGKFDEEGFIYIVDRKKDMVLVSGFNVYPNEIENVVAMHDAVLEVACIGVPDEKSGEAVKVFVVLREGASASESEIRDFCKESLTGYKVPRHVEFRDDLPKSNVGKILRRELRE